MKQIIWGLKEKITDRDLDFRVRLFNIMAIGGALMSFFTVIQSLLTGRLELALVSAFLIALSIALLVYAIKTGKYRKCYYITIIVIFLGFFPYLFFLSGGYLGGVPAVFIFAVLFTILMLKGKAAFIFSLVELVVYAGICCIAYYIPETVRWYQSEGEIVSDIIFTYTTIGIVCGVVLYYHIQEYSYQRELLKEQNRQLKHYDEAKSTFLTTVAHEIKNPLNIIGLYAQDTYELAAEEEVDLQQIMENQKIVENTVMRLDRIVVDLMDTVSIEQGRLSLDITSMDTAAVIREAVRFWQEKNNHDSLNGNKIILRIEKDPAPIMGDYSRIIQVMINLLSNASVHTKNGNITVTLKADEEKQTISVEDTGEGMAVEVKEEAFKGYVSTNKDYWRHGIGLYICHQIIEAHGGEIWIDSKLGVGTKITFTLPFKGE